MHNLLVALPFVMIGIVFMSHIHHPDRRKRTLDSFYSRHYHLYLAIFWYGWIVELISVMTDIFAEYGQGILYEAFTYLNGEETRFHEEVATMWQYFLTDSRPLARASVRAI